jgi:hypothetical protein
MKQHLCIVLTNKIKATRFQLAVMCLAKYPDQQVVDFRPTSRDLWDATRPCKDFKEACY